MIGRVIHAVAALLLAVALFGLGAESRSVAHYGVTLPGGAPAVVWEPGPQRPYGERPDFAKPLPVVVLAHGFAGSTAMMSSLARRLARAGYAVIAFDFTGHGRHPKPFGPEVARDALRDEVDAALDYARLQPHYDAQRAVLMGHSMGAGVVLRQAQRDPGVAGVVAISGAVEPTGPYPPPNVLLIWATGDPDRLISRARSAGAMLAEREQLVADRTYGDPERGTAVRISEVDGADHVSILFSQEAAKRILDWVRQTAGPGATSTVALGGDARLRWTALGILAFLVLAWGLPRAIAPLSRRVLLAPIEKPLLRIGLLAGSLVAAVVLLAAQDVATGGGPLSFVPLVGGRELFSFFALAGVLLSVLAALGGRARFEGLGATGTWLGAGLVFAFVYAVLGALTAPYVSTFPAPARLVPALISAVLLLPFFASFEWLLRGPGPTGIWLPIVGRLLTVVVMVAGALIGAVPFIVLLMIAPIVLYFALFELLAYRLSREMPNPWVPALFQAAFTAFSFASVFPLAS